MRRALLLVLDSVGVGHAPDAADFGDAGANTLDHILAHQPDLELPALRSIGLDLILEGAAGRQVRDRWQSSAMPAGIGWMRQQSAGKDTTTGHWELAGSVTREPFAVFSRFPDELVTAIERRAGVRFIGNLAASGTAILDDLGPAHLESGCPILYTSADSVLQIAAHEDRLSDDRLQALCLAAREVIDQRGLRIGRVIARPFRGVPGNWQRTAGRRDYSLAPPFTMLNRMQEHGVMVTGIGKIADIFAGSGIDDTLPTHDNDEGCEIIEQLWRQGREGLVFANLVDFDSRYGHRRDVAGYAGCLARFDRFLQRFLPLVADAGPGACVLITADHGNDPAWPGTDHTREQVPVWFLGGGGRRWIGARDSFADAAASLLEWFGLPGAGAVDPGARSWLGPHSKQTANL